MSFHDKGDWRHRSNGLNKSSSQPNYYYIPKELNTYNTTYLPLIGRSQQAEIFSNQIDRSNKIKNEILDSKYKFLYHRGIDDKNRNKFKDSWTDFFKRKEREKNRKKIYKIIKEEPFSSSDEDIYENEIFKKGLNSLPSKIEDKIKLKRYLPAKKDLVKLMMKVNEHVNDKVDKNTYLLSKNIHNLENGYDDLRDMIQYKINRIERKQEEDFSDLRKYFKKRAERVKNKFDDTLLLGSGRSVINGSNIENNYYRPNMKENIEKLQTYEIAKRIKNIPKLLDNMIEDVENIREYRKEQKYDFLNNLNESLKGYYNPLYDDIGDIYDNYLGYNDYDDYYLSNNNNLFNFDNSYLGKTTPKNYNAYKYSKPKTEIKRNSDLLSMSKTDIEKLKKNLKPLSYQSPRKKRDDKDLLSGKDLMEIYKIRNSKPRLKYNNSKNTNKINIQENKAVNKLKESEVVKNSKQNTNKEKKDEDDDVVVIDSDDNKSKKNENKNDETKKENNKEEKKEEKKEESDKSDDDDNEDSNDNEDNEEGDDEEDNDGK